MPTVRYAARPFVDDDQASPPLAAAPAMWSRTLITFYETDPDIVASVLPRPLEPTAKPLVRVNIAEVDMPGTDHTLGAAVFSVTARHDGLDGLYDLMMVMTTEQAVTGGRETFGEPKKLGQVALTREGDRAHGTITRMGVTFIEVAGTVAETLEPRELSERTTFYFKFLMDPQGGGFDHDPSLVHCRRTEQQRMLERVDAEVTLRESPLDPVVDLPVRRIVSCEYAESNTTQQGVIVGTVPSEWVLPFAHQRYDFLAPLRHRALAAPGL